MGGPGRSGPGLKNIYFELLPDGSHSLARQKGHMLIMPGRELIQLGIRRRSLRPSPPLVRTPKPACRLTFISALGDRYLRLRAKIGPKPAKTNYKPAKTGPKPNKTDPKPATNQNLRFRADISVVGADILTCRPQAGLESKCGTCFKPRFWNRASGPWSWARVPT